MKFKSVHFSNVSYMKGLKNNLISISHLCDVDYEVLFNNNEGRVIDSNNVIVLTTNLRSDIYILNMFLFDNSLRSCFFSRSQSHLNWL